MISKKYVRIYVREEKVLANDPHMTAMIEGFFVFCDYLLLTRRSPDGPEVSTHAENPDEFVHSSQAVTA